MKRFNLRFVTIFFLLSLGLIHLSAQEKNITGTVIDSGTGNALPGVNVFVKGAPQQGTITDLDGNYSIPVPGSESVLVYSYVGYTKKEKQVGDKSVIDVGLEEDVAELEEVVVIGYGVQKKSDLTGAVVSVESEEIEKSTAGRINEAIQGKLAGVSVTQNSGSPGGSVSIRVRGLGSINNNDPLVVIDGFPTKEGLNNLNPDDIASIDVLKDASATAIYGARGANGVLMVTTKSGTKGESKINFNASYGIQDLGSDYPMLNSVEYANYVNELQASSGSDPYFVKTDDNGNVIPVEEWLPKDSADINWLDVVTREPQAASIQKYTLSASGGNESARYMASVGYFDQNGILKGSGYRRLNFRINADGNVKDWIKVGARFNYANSQRDNILEHAVGRSVVGRALRQMPILEPYRDDGTFNVANDNPGRIRNALRSCLQNDNTSTNNDLVGTFFTEFTLFEGLVYKISAGGSLNNYWYEYYQPIYGRPSDAFNESQAQASRSSNFQYNWLLENTLTYSKTFADVHDFTALIGYTAQEDRWEGLYASVRDFVHPSVKQMGSASELENIDGAVREWKLQSQLARVNYSYNNKYLLTASVRRDGSSRFGPEYRYGVFPSFSLAWKISEEPFMQGLSSISSLKLRGGWGQTGNQEIPSYQYYSRLDFVSYVTGNTVLLNQGVAPQAYPNKAIHWESTEMTNVGLDMSMWENKLSLVVEYYHRGTNGMLLRKPLPGSAGYRSDPYRNVGEITNDGLEAVVTHKRVLGDFNYTISMNAAYNRNKVVSLGGSTPIQGASQSDVQMGYLTRTEEGHPIGGFYGHVMDGIFQSQGEVDAHAFQSPGTAPGDVKFRDINGDNVINGDDRTYIGSPWPDLTYGLSTNFSYKAISLSLFFQGVQGNEIYYMDRTFYEGMNSYVNQSKRILDEHYWTPDNPSQTMPRISDSDPNSNSRISSRFVEDGSFLRLKNVTLSYFLPQKAAQRIKVQDAQLFIKANNVLTFTNFSGLDPEIGEFNNQSTNAGVAIGQYPVARTFTIGMKLGL